jgi:hypothetical protein
MSCVGGWDDWLRLRLECARRRSAFVGGCERVIVSYRDGGVVIGGEHEFGVLRGENTCVRGGGSFVD